MAKARAATVGGAFVATIAFNKVWFQSKMALDRLELMFATASLEQAHEVVVASMARQASRMRANMPFRPETLSRDLYCTFGPIHDGSPRCRNLEERLDQKLVKSCFRQRDDSILLRVTSQYASGQLFEEAIHFSDSVCLIRPENGMIGICQANNTG